VSHGLGRRSATPGRPGGTGLGVARIAAGFGVVGAALLGIYPPGFVAQVVALAVGLAASSFFPVIIMGIFSKRMNREGAIAGMLSGIGVTSIYIWYFKFGGGTPDELFLGISPEGFGSVGMLVNFAVAIAVSRFTAPPPEDIQKLIEDIRIPSGAGEAHEMQVTPAHED